MKRTKNPDDDWSAQSVAFDVFPKGVKVQIASLVASAYRQSEEKVCAS